MNDMIKKDEEHWQFQYLWRFLEIHITHRAAMLNFLLVAAGFFAYGITTVGAPLPKALLSFAASASAVSFLALDIVTLRKIQNIKIKLIQHLNKKNKDAQEAVPDLVTVLGGSADRMDEGFPSQRAVAKDPFWTTVIGVVMVSVFAALGTDASMQRVGASDLGRWVLDAAVFLVLGLSCFVIGYRTSIRVSTVNSLLTESDIEGG